MSAEATIAQVVFAVQGLRALLYGFAAVLLGSVFAAEGLSAVEAGAIFTAMLLGMAVGSVAAGRWAESFGRPRVYRALFVVLGLAGTVFAVTSWTPLLVIAALTGTVSTDANESGPITSLEQALLSDMDARKRAHAFGRYNAIAYLCGALGALAAGGPAAFQHLVPAVPADQRWLLAFPVIAALCLLLTMRLPVEDKYRTGQRGLTRSRPQARRLAGLFAVDAFGGGLVVQSFIVFWFERRFGAPVELMGAVFFGVGLIQAGSSLLAPRIARRIGLLNTMVFTHLPSNALLAVIPFMPTLPLAVVALLARSALSQMDVPARQAYIAAMVDPGERTAAAAYTNGARYAARPAGPVVAGAFMQNAALASPFLAAGAIKAAYDVALFLSFRSIRVRDGQ